jgi:hypothetical protein
MIVNFIIRNKKLIAKEVGRKAVLVVIEHKDSGLENIQVLDFESFKTKKQGIRVGQPD